MPALSCETNVYPHNLFDEEFIPSDFAVRNWWVLHTRPRQEKSLARQLTATETPFYLPLVAKRSRLRGRLHKSYMPLFGGYVFVLADADERIGALSTSRVVRSLAVPDQNGLWHDLRQVHRLITSGAAVTPEDRLAPGASVEIKYGAFAGMKGKIVSTATGRRFVVAIHFIHREASVLLDDSYLAAVNDV